MGNDLFLGDPFGVVELNNAADGGVAQGCHQGDDDKEGGGFEQAGVRGEADQGCQTRCCLFSGFNQLDCQVR